MAGFLFMNVCDMLINEKTILDKFRNLNKKTKKDGKKGFYNDQFQEY